MNPPASNPAEDEAVASSARIEPPRSIREIERSAIRSDVAQLVTSRLFWAGLAVKLFCSMFCGSHFATRWFAPFVYEFVRSGFTNPYESFLARGEPLAFPYGPGMLLSFAPAFLPSLVVPFSASGPIALFLLRVPILAADLLICLLLLRWLRLHARDVIVTYWLSPIVLYASYVHGQLDLVPTALLVASLYLCFARRFDAAAFVFGFALATKSHLLIGAPFITIYLYRLRKPRLAWLRFSAIAGVVALALYALPVTSPAFRTMVFGSAESRRLWSVAIPYGPSGLVLLVAPAALAVALLRFATYRKLNRELTLMYLGAVYVALVALVPPQPGWFLWSLPFVAYFGAQHSRVGPFAILATSASYLAYFLISDPVVFFEAFDPFIGRGNGAHVAALLESTSPGVFSRFGSSIAWTVLFSAIILLAFLMYRRGVRSNAVYNFREESFMIGIGGDSGAGKHTIGRDLGALIGDQISLLNGDDNHKWERGHAMWRRFTHLDPRGNLLRDQMRGLASLRDGRSIRQRHYDHDVGRFTDPILLKPNDFICVIGLHPFYLASQRELLHLKVFVDTNETLRREWKVARDVAKRGYSPEKVLEQMEMRMSDSDKYVRPQSQHADVVIRHLPGADEPTRVQVSFVLSSNLDPLLLLDALETVPTIAIDWQPDEALTRDLITVSGEVHADQLQILAAAIVPNLEEVLEFDAWHSGGRGLVQLVLLHAISARLRDGRTHLEVT